MTVAQDVTEIERELLELCAISSFTGEEGPLCDHLERALVVALGHSAVTRDGHSLVATLPSRPNAVPIVLAGHLDVVRTTHDGPSRVEDEKLYGPGAADMKSGLVVMLALARMSVVEPSRHATTLVFYEREEGPYLENRLGELLDRFELLRSAKFAVCLEPSANVLQLGCMGSLHGRVTFHGRTSHSARPWQGENAIHKSAGVLTRLAARPVLDTHIDGLQFREVMSATLADGGRGRNVVPDVFHLNVNVRFAPGRTVEDAERDLRELVGADADVDVIDRSPSALPAANHPLVIELRDAGAVGVEPKQAWTDVARFAAYGVPAVNFGPGTQSQAHQRNEWTHRGDLARGMEIFRHWLFPAK